MPSSLLSQLRVLAAARPGAIALEDDAEQVAFAALLARAEALAGALLDRHGGPLAGARVVLYGAPSARWLSAFFGALLAGGAVVPLSAAYPPSELAWLASDARASFALLGSERGEAERALAEGREVLSLDASVPLGEGALPELDDEGVAVFLYTSGTTGKPKGAMLSHRALATQARLIGEAWALGEHDTLLHALPLHHLHGLCISLLSSLLAGARVRMLPRFDAERIWQAFAAREATVWMAVPTMYQKLLEHLESGAAPRGADRAALEAGARALRLATSGSAALPASLAERWRAVTGTIPLERFGMTEIGVGTSNPLDPEARRAGTVGQPLATVELRLVGDDGGEDGAAPPGAQRGDAGDGPGELWVRGPSLFSGYFGREEATRDAFSDGWFKTGDVGVREDGYVRLLGRTSVDILKSGGYKLSALEIEEVLREHPAVREIAVVGLPDATWGDRVVAAVVPHEGRAGELSSERVRAWARDRLASYKIPREVVVLSALPRNALGKVVKPELVRLLAR